MNATFTPEAKCLQIAEAYSLDCCDFIKSNFQVTLDGSDESIQHIETALEQFHKDLPGAKPSQEEIYQFAKVFGSYVGETFRKNHGATWGIVTLDGQQCPGLQAWRNGGLFWPWGKAQNRIKNGAEDNIWHYYQVLVEKHGGGLASPPSGSAPPPTKSAWWQRIFGG